MPRSSGKQQGSGDDADQVGLRSLLALGDLELDTLVLLEAAIAVGLDRAVVHEDVGAVVHLDEAVALFAVEPLDDALRHDALLLARASRSGSKIAPPRLAVVAFAPIP